MARPALVRPLVGWPLLPLPDAGGDLRYPTFEESVRQSIKVILRTRPGEQLMRPHFGAGLERFVHEQNTLATRRRIRDLVTESLARWEPRIALDRVEVTEHPERPTHVRVVISYRLRRTGAPQQLGLSMNLDG
jgi:phage baseplate assembly protein W